MSTLFISDLHLDPSRPDITALFVDFLRQRASEADALYILGDLFEAWVGDDEDQPDTLRVRKELLRLTNGGTPAYFMHGNRDFLVGDAFCTQTGCKLLEDGSVVDVYGQRVLLMHGDLLCTDDVEYQAFRKLVRDPGWQQMFLSKTLDERRAMAAQVRAETTASVAGKDEDIMDVNQRSVEDAFNKHEVDILLHGHTHRPAIHDFKLGERQLTRIVLGAWYEQGSTCCWQADSGYALEFLPPP